MKPPPKRQRLPIRDHPDADLHQKRARNDQRLKSIFESIFEKYGKDFDGVGDEIDLETGEIVVNNGHILAMTDEKDVGDADDFSADDGQTHASSWQSDEDGDSLMGEAEMYTLPTEPRNPSILQMTQNDDEEDELASSEIDWFRLGKRKPTTLDPWCLPEHGPRNFEETEIEPSWRAPPLPEKLITHGKKSTFRAPSPYSIRGDSDQSSPGTSLWARKPRKRRRRSITPHRRNSYLDAESNTVNRIISHSSDTPGMCAQGHSPWTIEEDQILCRLKSTTTLMYKEMEEYLPHHSARTMGSRWQYINSRNKNQQEEFLRPNTPALLGQGHLPRKMEEDQLLCHLRATSTRTWRDMEQRFPNRHNNSIQCHWKYMEQRDEAGEKLEHLAGPTQSTSQTGPLPNSTKSKTSHEVSVVGKPDHTLTFEDERESSPNNYSSDIYIQPNPHHTPRIAQGLGKDFQDDNTRFAQITEERAQLTVGVNTADNAGDATTTKDTDMIPAVDDQTNDAAPGDLNHISGISSRGLHDDKLPQKPPFISDAEDVDSSSQDAFSIAKASALEADAVRSSSRAPVTTYVTDLTWTKPESSPRTTRREIWDSTSPMPPPHNAVGLEVEVALRRNDADRPLSSCKSLCLRRPYDLGDESITKALEHNDSRSTPEDEPKTGTTLSSANPRVQVVIPRVQKYCVLTKKEQSKDKLIERVQSIPSTKLFNFKNQEAALVLGERLSRERGGSADPLHFTIKRSPGPEMADSQPLNDIPFLETISGIAPPPRNGVKKPRKSIIARFSSPEKDGCSDDEISLIGKTVGTPVRIKSASVASSAIKSKNR